MACPFARQQIALWCNCTCLGYVLPWRRSCCYGDHHANNLARANACWWTLRPSCSSCTLVLVMSLKLSEHVKECLSTWAHMRPFNMNQGFLHQNHSITILLVTFTQCTQQHDKQYKHGISSILDWFWFVMTATKDVFATVLWDYSAFTLITLVKITVLWGHTSSPQSQNYI